MAVALKEPGNKAVKTGCRLLMAFAFLAWAPMLSAQQPFLKPHDFKPLTERPWGDPASSDATAVIERIFLEPDFHIRYSVLKSYLEVVPLDQFGKAFDAAIRMEGTQLPDHLVSLMLRIWAKRDPESALQRVDQLFEVVGMEGWLHFGYGIDNEAITVQNHEAIQKSRFWLKRDTLTSFADGVDVSTIGGDKKRRLFESFSQQWFRRFDTWPRDRQRDDFRDLPDLIRSLDKGELPGHTGNLQGKLEMEISMRKNLVAHPEEAARIIETYETRYRAELSAEFLLLWSKLDATGMRKWAEARAEPLDVDRDGWIAKCILFQQADEETRRKWLNDLRPDEKDIALAELVGWEPEIAMEEALRTKDAEIISGVLPFSVDAFDVANANLAGFDFLSRFDLSRLPEDVLDSRKVETVTYIMEDWGEVDIGACARFGIRCLKHSSWADWEGLCGVFTGSERISDHGSVLNRTLAALRVWAVVRPDEMKAWIATEPDPELRKALTWLLEHPWGQDSEP